MTMKKTNPHNITNAVSPLKKKSSYKGGTKIKGVATIGKTFAGTKMQLRHGGFGPSKGNKNKPGYNINTSFRIPNKPQRKAGTPPPAPAKPYGYGPDGQIVFNPQITVQGSTINNNNEDININQNAGGTKDNTTETVTTTEERELESYDDFWNSRIKDKSKWSKGMRQYLKGVDMNDPDAVEKARQEWERVSRKHAHKRNKGKKTKTVTTTKTVNNGGVGGDVNQSVTINK